MNKKPYAKPLSSIIAITACSILRSSGGSSNDVKMHNEVVTFGDDGDDGYGIQY